MDRIRVLLLDDALRQLAAQKLAREAPGQTLQATALVREAYGSSEKICNTASEEQAP